MPGLRKRALVAKPARQRADAWAEFLAGGEGTWKVRNLTVTLSDVEVGDDRIAFTVEAVRANGKVAYSDRHVVINPPLYHPDGGTDDDGDPTYSLNIRAILRGIVEGQLP